MLLEVSFLAAQLFSGDLWDRAGGPYLAVRMRIAGSHHRAAVFEDLDVIDLRHCPQFVELRGPCLYYAHNILWRHGGQGQVVARGETDYPAQAWLAFRDQQPAVFNVDAVVP